MSSDNRMSLTVTSICSLFKLRFFVAYLIYKIRTLEILLLCYAFNKVRVFEINWLMVQIVQLTYNTAIVNGKWSMYCHSTVFEVV